MFAQSDLRSLLNEAESWPIEVIAQQSGVSEKSITSYLRDGSGMDSDEFVRLSNWADRHAGMTAVCVPVFAKYQGTHAMGAIVGPSANDLPRGRKFEPGSINASIREVGMDPAKLATMLDHRGGAQMGNDERVRGSEVAAGLVKAVQPKVA